jgi:hypothetical protein
MTEAAARRGSDGWRPTFDSGYVGARDRSLEKQRTRDCSNVFNIVASQSLRFSSSLFPQPSYLNIRVPQSMYFYHLFGLYFSDRGLSVASSCTFLLTYYDFSHTFRKANALSAHSTRQYPPDSTAVSSQGRENGYAESHDHE